MPREYRDPTGKLIGYSTSPRERYKWVPKWIAYLGLAYFAYHIIKHNF